MEFAGANHLAFVEWDRNACNTLRENYISELVHEEDVRLFDFTDYKDVDIVAGGPPCQPFSLGGKAQGYDDRRDMFPSALSAIRTLMPKVFVFENVKGLLRKAFAEYFEYIILQLTYPTIQPVSTNWRENYKILKELKTLKKTNETYQVKYKLINAADYGIPQIRERVIIVGFRHDLNANWDFPQATHSSDSLLWSKYITGEYWEQHSIKNYIPEDYCLKVQNYLNKKYGFFKPAQNPWKTVRDAIKGLGEPQDTGEHSIRHGAKEYPGHTGSNIDEPSKTIKAGAHGVPGGENMIKYPNGNVRYYSIAEAKRIQTFPDEYRIYGTWTEAMRQLGNAVPVELAKLISLSIFNALEKSQSPQDLHSKFPPYYNTAYASSQNKAFL